MQLYADKEGFLVEIARQQGGRIFYFPQGGGFERSLPEIEFHEKFSPSAPLAYYPGFVGADWLDASARIPAWLNGLRWNGWAQPCFERNAADVVAKDIPDMKFDPARNAYVLPADPECGRDEEEVFGAMSLPTFKGLITVWPIGAGSWCWDEVGTDSD